MRCSSFSEWISVNIVVERNIRSILFLVCAIICGYIYQVQVFADIIIMLESYSGVINLQFSVLGQLLLQCPPFRLSYQGLGEPLCFAAFGPFATCAFYLLHASARLPQLRNLNVSYYNI